jgi:hypothetical protein
MRLGLVPIAFRFRGKTGRLSAIYHCFLEQPGKALHPAQIARQTGISFIEVNTRLEATPELFVKLPKRPDGVTRYRLTSVMTAKPPEEVEAFLTGSERRENLVLYAVGAMILGLFLVVVVLVGPAL